MKKILFICLTLLVLILLFCAALFLGKRSTPSENIFIPTPTPVLPGNPNHQLPTPNPTTNTIQTTPSSTEENPGLNSPRMSDIDKYAQNFNKTNYPDVFLANLSPYETSSFKMTVTFVSYPTGHYRINVEAKVTEEEKAKQDFLTWVKNQGLTDQQVSSLDIVYN